MECYNKPNDVKKEMSCYYCSKDFGKKSLKLHGKRKKVICNDCLSYFAKTLHKTKARRYILAGYGGIFTIAALYIGTKAYSNNDSNATLFLVFGLIGLVALIFNYIRIKQINDWLVIEEYSGVEK
jgi:hypothetical protein